MTLGSTYDHQRVRDIHRVTTLRKLYSGHRVRRAQIPVLQEVDSGSQSICGLPQFAHSCSTCLDRLVPTAGGEHASLGRLYPSHNTNWRVVLGHLSSLASSHVKHSTCVVRATGEYIRAILQTTTHNQSWSIDTVTLAVNVSTHLVPTYTQYRPLVGVHRLSLRLAARSNLIYADLLIINIL